MSTPDIFDAGLGQYVAFPPGYVLPKITTPDTPWFWRANISSMPPPPGVIPNFIDPPTRDIWDKVCISICFPLATIAVAIRLYTKIALLRTPGWEDWTCIAGWLGTIIFGVIQLLQDRYGGGRHLWDTTGYDFTVWARLGWVNEIIYGPVIFAVKVSVLLLYLRVFQPIRGTFIALYLILWMNLTGYTVGTFLEIFQCSPLRKRWLPFYPGTCLPQRSLQIASAVCNIISDFAILILPIVSVWNLRTTRKKKAGLIAVFSFGVVGCVAAILRLIDIVSHGWKGDAPWNLYRLNVWSLVELTCGLVCGSLPLIPAFFRHMPRVRLAISIKSVTNPSTGYGLSTSKSELTSQSGGIVLASASSDPFRRSRKGRREAWEDLDDLEFKIGDDLNRSHQGSANDLSKQKQPVVRTFETRDDKTMEMVDIAVVK